jgi:hypothetical protein
VALSESSLVYTRAVPSETEPSTDLDLDLLEFLGSLTPAERMRRHESALQLVLALKKAAIRHHGFDFELLRPDNAAAELDVVKRRIQK